MWWHLHVSSVVGEGFRSYLCAIYASPAPSERLMLLVHSAVVTAAALDHVVVRLPSTDPSVFGGLLCFCPSGYSYGAHMGALKVAQKVCRRPYALNLALF